MKIKNVNDIVAHRLCLGCGVCFFLCPEERIRLVDVQDDGIRPVVQPGGCSDCDICLKACPGIQVSAPYQTIKKEQSKGHLSKEWGAFDEIWEGYATNPEIRFKGSSGGICTALSLYCLEHGIAGGVLHIGSDLEKPWKNKTYRSTTREELIVRTGSRYSPASPCDGLKRIEGSEDASIFIGKPCDVTGLQMVQKLKPELARKMALSIGFFCAGTPATKGTIDLLKLYNIDYTLIHGLRYRGMGWPGMATAHFKDRDRDPFCLPYKYSWKFLQKYRPFRCFLCPDITSELADISVGDPWYREMGKGEIGRSLVLVRTENGRKIFQKALEQKYIAAEQVDPCLIYSSQKNLLEKRQAIWGRLVALKILGIPSPKFDGFYLFENWLDLPLRAKFKSIFGTAKRIIQRNYFRPLDYSGYINQ